MAGRWVELTLLGGGDWPGKALESPPGHHLAGTPNGHTSLHQPLVSGSARQGSIYHRPRNKRVI